MQFQPPVNGTYWTEDAAGDESLHGFEINMGFLIHGSDQWQPDIHMPRCLLLDYDPTRATKRLKNKIMSPLVLVIM